MDGGKEQWLKGKEETVVDFLEESLEFRDSFGYEVGTMANRKGRTVDPAGLEYNPSGEQQVHLTERGGLETEVGGVSSVEVMQREMGVPGDTGETGEKVRSIYCKESEAQIALALHLPRASFGH